MGSKATWSWDEIRREQPLNDRRVATYTVLMEAQHVIAEQRARAGVSDEVLVDALDASASPAPEAESEEELYSGSVRRYVEALGGRVEGRDAVFAEGRVQLPELGG